MNQSLPLWCCLNTESQQALMIALKNLKATTFSEPQPVWRDWKLEVMPLDLRDIEGAQEYYDKFMRQKPKPGSKRVV